MCHPREVLVKGHPVRVIRRGSSLPGIVFGEIPCRGSNRTRCQPRLQLQRDRAATRRTQDAMRRLDDSGRVPVLLKRWGDARGAGASRGSARQQCRAEGVVAQQWCSKRRVRRRLSAHARRRAAAPAGINVVGPRQACPSSELTAWSVAAVSPFTAIVGQEEVKLAF